MKNVWLLLSLCLLLATSIQANDNSPQQSNTTFTGTGGTIGYTNFEYCFTMTVSGLTAPLSGTDGLQSVCVDLEHPELSSLGVRLISPDGTANILYEFTANGSTFTNTCFSDAASQDIADGTSPYTDVFSPQIPLSNINNGSDGNGVWRICAKNFSGNSIEGTLNSWTLEFGDNIEPPVETCPDSLTLSDIHTSETFSASSTISSTATVPANEEVGYEAGEEIGLNSGFQVEPAGIFRAIIQNCDTITNDTMTNDTMMNPISSGITSLTVNQVIDGSNQVRAVSVRAPQNLDSNKVYPLVFAFHGNGGTGQGFLNNSSLTTLIDAGNFIGVYPDGYLNSWNLGAAAGNEASNADEIYFVGEILNQLGAYSNIDTSTVYALGTSNGGAVVNYLGKQASFFRAIAPIVSQQTVPMENWVAPRTMSVFQINGLDDGLIPWEGGNSPGIGHTFMSAQASAENWAAQFNCNSMPVTTSDVWGSNNVTSYEYGNCDDGHEVIYHLIEGAGHDGGIPGDPDYYSRIWTFFSMH